MTDRHIAVAQWADIDAAPDLDGPAKQRVATIFTEQAWAHVVWVPTWLLEDTDKTIETVAASDHLAVGAVEDYSAKAWQLTQPHIQAGTGGEFLPKSSVVVFERVHGVDTIETPQTGLGAFAGGGE